MNIFAPIQWLADTVTNLIFPRSDTLLAGAVNFFVFDTIKIFLLLAVIIFIASFLRTYLPPEKIRDVLARRSKYEGNVAASLLGTVTPFCSCSAIPLFLGFSQAGVPLGTTFSFLVTSPMVNEVAFVMLLGLFGWKLAVLYVGSGLVIAIVSGVVIGRMSPERLVEPFVLKAVGITGAELPAMSQKERIGYATGYTLDMLKKVWPYVVVGIALGAFIHGYVPTDFLVRYVGDGKWYAVPAAVLVGIPLYSNAAGIVPLVGALTDKGVSLGTALAFMMAVTALSLPELMILKRVMKPKLIGIFVGIVGLGIVCTGYLFNWLLR